MIAVEQLTKYFHKTLAVNSISFTVKKGETMVLLGTSGCGKTTTLRMVNRLLEPTSGNITVNGKSIFLQQPEQLRRSMGYVLQNNGLFPHYSIAENIAIVPQLQKWNKEKIQKRVWELLEKLQLPPEQYASAYPDQLSGGQKQRVGLARALAADPPILLMDEPFGALDPITRAAIRKEFKTLDELKRKTIILVTHDVQEAFELGDQICLMHKGEIMQTGAPVELLLKPMNKFVQHFFDQQRLLLELKAVTPNAIWNYLPSGQQVESNNPIDSNKNLWEIMEGFSSYNGNEQMITVYNEVSKEYKTIYFNDILHALNQYKGAL